MSRSPPADLDAATAARTVEDLKARGVEFVTPVVDEGYGLVTRFKVPGAGELGLYEPRHPSPLAEFADG